MTTEMVRRKDKRRRDRKDAGKVLCVIKMRKVPRELSYGRKVQHSFPGVP